MKTNIGRIPFRGQGTSCSMWEERFFDEVLGRYGAPAYVRRGRAVEDALQDLLEHCKKWRDERLHMVRTRLAVLHALAGSWDALLPLLRDDDQAGLLQELCTTLCPRLRSNVQPTSSRRPLARIIRELVSSIERFNQRWRDYVANMDLTRLNEVREKYNRYYVLEKECAVRSAMVARQGFRPLPPFTRDDLVKLLPDLPVPQLKE
jgi:hypothetical protein